MPVSAAPRTGITRWSAEADPFNRTQTDADHALLDDLVGIDLHDGTLAARPAASIRGRYYTESAASAGLPGTTWREDGAGWRSIGSRVLSTGTGDIAQVVAGVTGQTADLQQWRGGASTLGRVDNTGQLFAVGAQLGPSPQSALAAMLGVTPSAAAAVAAIIRGAVSQSGDLQQWQTNTGSVLAKVDSLGVGTFAGLTTAGTMTGRLARWTSAAVGDVPVQATGFPGQTANLQEWRTSTPTVVASVDPTGLGTFTGGLTTAGTVTGRLARWTAAAVGDVVQQVTGFAGQTGNLQEWRTSTPTVVASVAADGSATFANLTTAGTLTGRLARWTSAAVGDVVQQVTGFAGQTGDLTQWRSSTPTVLAKVDSAGVGTFAGLTTAGTVTGRLARWSSAAIGDVPVQINGFLGQTGNLTEWRTSTGTVLTKIGSDGSLTLPFMFFPTTSSYFDGVGTSSPTLQVNTFAAGNKGIAIKPAVGQSANMQEWQNSSGSPVGWIDQNGNPHFATGIFNQVQVAAGGSAVLSLGSIGGIAPNPAAGSGYVYYSGTNIRARRPDGTDVVLV